MDCFTVEILKYMAEYGIIEGSYLRIKDIEPIINRQQNADGTIKEVTLSVEEQLAQLPTGWKPVDRIDEDAMQSDNPDNIIVAVPYDNGDRISYRYETKFDTQKVRTQIRELKDNLAATDYRVTKCYEASLLNQPLPYDISALHKERQQVRDKINELEALI